ncbi:hypothetical protein [Streptomyces massasporeus]|uniref:hypothetical protein n=1 Tax=Streptomyces massasporeus TaxID=67324 RepID=UPI00167B20EE|nr:hypothetical protein [Streptomyces massasporeus]GGV91647.1 hypothetical protein GCM10010228_82560 [Streptomyces massasporeus]
MTVQPDPKLVAAVEEAMSPPTYYRDDSPLPPYGPTPPVEQPGIPPMSQRTTETARAVMFCSLATVPPGLIAVAVMVASEHANPTVIGMICAAPAAIAVPILAVARLLRGAKDLPPAEVHHHYAGHVDQRTVHTKTTGLWARTNNQQ